MKRVLIWIGVVALAIVVVAASVIGSALMGRQSVVDGYDLGNGGRVVADGIVTAAVLPAGDGRVALIDAGNDSDGKALLAELSRRSLGADAVEAVFLTHGHGDHIAAVKQFPNAKVYALDIELPLVEGREAARGPVTRLSPARPTGIRVTAVRDGEDVRVGALDVKVYALPGHTRGSAAYLANGLLFVGDSADAGSGGNLVPSAWAFSDSQAQNRASLAALDQRLHNEGVQVRAIVPAHSAVLTDGLAQLDAFARTSR